MTRQRCTPTRPVRVSISVRDTPAPSSRKTRPPTFSLVSKQASKTKQKRTPHHGRFVMCNHTNGHALSQHASRTTCFQNTAMRPSPEAADEPRTASTVWMSRQNDSGRAGEPGSASATVNGSPAWDQTEPGRIRSYVRRRSFDRFEEAARPPGALLLCREQLLANEKVDGCGFGNNCRGVGALTIGRAFITVSD